MSVFFTFIGILFFVVCIVGVWIILADKSRTKKLAGSKSTFERHTPRVAHRSARVLPKVPTNERVKPKIGQSAINTSLESSNDGITPRNINNDNIYRPASSSDGDNTPLTHRNPRKNNFSNIKNNSEVIKELSIPKSSKPVKLAKISSDVHQPAIKQPSSKAPSKQSNNLPRSRSGGVTRSKTIEIHPTTNKERIKTRTVGKRRRQDDEELHEDEKPKKKARTTKQSSHIISSADYDSAPRKKLKRNRTFDAEAEEPKRKKRSELIERISNIRESVGIPKYTESLVNTQAVQFFQQKAPVVDTPSRIKVPSAVHVHRNVVAIPMESDDEADFRMKAIPDLFDNTPTVSKPVNNTSLTTNTKENVSEIPKKVEENAKDDKPTGFSLSGGDNTASNTGVSLGGFEFNKPDTKSKVEDNNKDNATKEGAKDANTSTGFTTGFNFVKNDDKSNSEVSNNNTNTETKASGIGNGFAFPFTTEKKESPAKTTTTSGFNFTVSKDTEKKDEPVKSNGFSFTVSNDTERKDAPSGFSTSNFFKTQEPAKSDTTSTSSNIFNSGNGFTFDTNASKDNNNNNNNNNSTGTGFTFNIGGNANGSENKGFSIDTTNKSDTLKKIPAFGDFDKPATTTGSVTSLFTQPPTVLSEQTTTTPTPTPFSTGFTMNIPSTSGTTSAFPAFKTDTTTTTNSNPFGVSTDNKSISSGIGNNETNKSTSIGGGNGFNFTTSDKNSTTSTTTTPAFTGFTATTNTTPNTGGFNPFANKTSESVNPLTMSSNSFATNTTTSNPFEKKAEPAPAANGFSIGGGGFPNAISSGNGFTGFPKSETAATNTTTNPFMTATATTNSIGGGGAGIGGGAGFSIGGFTTPQGNPFGSATANDPSQIAKKDPAPFGASGLGGFPTATTAPATPFGLSTQPTAPTNPFGGATTTTPAFGATQSTSNPFGTTTTTTTGFQQSNNSFGANSSFGVNTGFGVSTTAAPAPANPFGGQPASTSFGGSNSFGAGPASGNPFGVSAQSFGAPAATTSGSSTPSFKARRRTKK